MATKRGLGKGLDAMISENRIAKEDNTPEENKTGEIMISINLIDTNKDQPRKSFKNESLSELAESIREHGIIEPLILQKNGNRYEIVAGERRFRAAKLAKIKEVPAIIKEYTDKERFEIQIIENIQREDINSIEEAQAYQKLIEEFGYTQDAAARRVSKSRTAITNSLRLLKLDERVQQMVIDELISGGHARALLGIEDNEIQYETAGKVFEEKLSVRDTEKLVRNIISGKNTVVKEKKALEDEAIYKNYANNLISLTGSKVEIQRKDVNRGKIIIDFQSADEFERIYDIFVKGGKE